MKRKIAMGAACLTVGTVLAGCGASSNQLTEPSTVETIETMTETTTVEVATPTEVTSVTEATTEAWMAKYVNATVLPKRNPDEVWGNEHKIEIRLNNGLHLFIPSFFDTWYEGAELMISGYGIRTDDNYFIPYYRVDVGKVYSAGDYFEVDTNTIFVGATDDHLRIKGEVGDELPSDDADNKYREIAQKDGRTYYIDFSPIIWDGGDSQESYTDFLDKFEDKIINSAWVE